MIEAFAILLWFSIGLGVVSVFAARHKVMDRVGTPTVVVGAMLWPCFVAAEVYKYLAKKRP